MKTIEITKTVTETITVEFPLYTTDGLHYFRFDDNGCICIKMHELSTFSIEEYNNKCYSESWMLLDKISEQEFYQVFDKVMEYFNEIRKK